MHKKRGLIKSDPATELKGLRSNVLGFPIRIEKLRLKERILDFADHTEGISPSRAGHRRSGVYDRTLGT